MNTVFNSSFGANLTFADYEDPKPDKFPYEFVLHGLAVTSVGFSGLIANVVCLLVLRQPALKCGRQGSVNVILTSMAAIDVVVLLCAILLFGLPGITNYLLNNRAENHTNIILEKIHDAFPFTISYVYPVGMAAQTASVYLTVAVTIERYVAVCLPFRARSICTRGRAHRAVAAVIFFAIAYNVTRFFEYKYEYQTVYFYKEDEAIWLNMSNYRLQATSLRSDDLYKMVYINWLYLLVMYVIPFLFLLVLNWQIGYAIHKARLRRPSIMVNGSTKMNRCSSTMSRTNGPGSPNNTNNHDSLASKDKRTRDRLEENEQQNLAIMLMVVVLVFVLCNVLAMVANILEAFNIVAVTLTQVSNLLVTLNSSVNLFIYCGFGKKFRRELKKLFGFRPKNQPQPSSRLHTGRQSSCREPPRHQSVRRILHQQEQLPSSLAVHPERNAVNCAPINPLTEKSANLHICCSRQQSNTSSNFAPQITTMSSFDLQSGRESVNGGPIIGDSPFFRYTWLSTSGVYVEDSSQTLVNTTSSSSYHVERLI